MEQSPQSAPWGNKAAPNPATGTSTYARRCGSFIR